MINGKKDELLSEEILLRFADEILRLSRIFTVL